MLTSSTSGVESRSPAVADNPSVTGKLASLIRLPIWQKTAVILLFAGIIIFWHFFKWNPQPVHSLTTQLLESLFPLLTLSWCFSRSAGWKELFMPRHETHGEKNRAFAPSLIGLSILFYVLGNSIWACNENILHIRQYPSWADVAYMLSYACLLCAVLSLPASNMSIQSRTPIFIDSIIILTATLTISWFFVPGPALVQFQTSEWQSKALCFAYPLIDVFMICCILLLVERSQLRSLRSIANILLIGLFCIIAVDTLCGIHLMHDKIGDQNDLEAFRSIGYMILGLGAFRIRTRPADTDADIAKPSEITQFQQMRLWRSLIPYALVPFVALLAYYVHLHPEKKMYESGIFIGAALLIVAVFARQVHSIFEINRLYFSLHVAYQSVEEKSRQSVEHAVNVEKLNIELNSAQAELVENNRTLAEARAIWETMAITDSLTTIANRRAFDERIGSEMARAKRYGYPMVLLILDVDRFKRYNDRYGHPAGDVVLIEIAALIRDTLRAGDFVARYGGEEFAVILPQTDNSAGWIVAKRIHQAISSHKFEHGSLTISIGAAQYEGEDIDPVSFTTSADNALYSAKRTGRNRIIFTNNIEDIAMLEELKILPTIIPNQAEETADIENSGNGDD